MQVTFTKNGLTKQIKSGYSWTTFFFGGLNQIFFRGEILIGLAVLFTTILSSGIVQIIYGFFANKVTAKRLLADGWVPSPSESPAINAAVLRWQS